MTSLFLRNQRLHTDEVFARINAIARSLAAVVTDQGIGLLVDCSEAGVLLTMAAIKMKLRVAFCPMREPAVVIDAWLLELGITRLVASFRPAENYNTQAELYVLDDLLAAAQALNFTPKSDDFISIIRSSGTCAKAKSVLLDGKSHEASALAVNEFFNFDASSTWALSLPIAHVSGLSIIFRALLSLGNIYIAEDHDALIYALSSGRVSHCSLVPAQVKRLLSLGLDLSHLQAVIVGGDKLLAADRDQALAASWPLYECYGMTETASMIAVRDCRILTSETVILPHAQLKISPEREIFIRSKSLFQGYYDQSFLNENANKDGFFATGDIGFFNEFNQLQLTSRKDNRIISGGENIQAEEIEAILEEHPYIDAAVVIGIFDEALGARPVAYISGDDELNAEEIRQFINNKLARYKCPTSFFCWPEALQGTMKKPRQRLIEYHYHSSPHPIG